MTDVADVVVVGGGPAGCATGLALARAGYSVEVVERHPEAYRCVGEVLPPAIRQPLTVLGLWDEFLASSALPSYGVRSVWGGHTAAHRSFLFDPQGPGWHVDRAEFDAMLRRSAVAAGRRPSARPGTRTARMNGRTSRRCAFALRLPPPR